MKKPLNIGWQFLIKFLLAILICAIADHPVFDPPDPARYTGDIIGAVIALWIIPFVLGSAFAIITAIMNKGKPG
jgi:hypothetical protein